MAIEVMSINEFLNGNYAKPYDDVEYYGERLGDITNLFFRMLVMALVIKYLPAAIFYFSLPLGGL